MSASDPVRESHELFIEACKTCSVGDIVSILADDCVWMPANETTMYGLDEIREWFEEYFENFRLAALAEAERSITVIADCAIERWDYSVAILPLAGGQRIRDDGRFLMVWTRQADGSWKIVQFMANSMRPIGSGTSRFMVRMMQRGKEASGQGD
jgi:ketosteroid isomerase-like protein